VFLHKSIKRIDNSRIDVSKGYIIKRIDGNILKKMFGVPNRCRSTALQLTLDITPTDDHISLIKLDFFTRLMKNSYTNKITQVMSDINQKDLSTEIAKITNSYDDPIVRSQNNLEIKAEAVKNVIETSLTAERRCDERCKEIKDIFRSKNREELPAKLFEIIKF
jgi:hypothetical protein